MNLDDELPNDTPEDEVQYRLTPKGLLLISLFKSETFSKYIDLENEDAMKIASEAWAYFENHIRKHFGAGDSAGGIVFDTNGGEFYSIGVGDLNEEEEEDDEENDDELK